MSIIQGVSSGLAVPPFYPFTISNSLRFNAGDDPFLSRTPSAASNRKTWTWSAWVKRGVIDNTVRELFGTAAEGDVLRFTDSRIGWFNNGSASSFLDTTALFTDPSAWYNIVLAFDTTESTASDRVKLYVNGTQVAFDNNTTFPSSGYEGDINNTEAQFIGKGHSVSEFDGYLAEINFIDGQALGPGSFGETKNDIWMASNLGSFTAATTTVSSFSSGASSITVSSATGIAIGQQVEGTGIASSTFVTGVSSTTISLSQNTDGSSSGNYTFGNYGRNGFRLQFAQTGTGTGSSSTVGADTSGNGNHFTSSGLASTDQMSDSPTNNFATLGAQRTLTHTLSEGRLKSTNSSGTHGGTTATFNYPTSGKWYHEVTIDATDSSTGNGVAIGNQIDRDVSDWGSYLNLVAYIGNGKKFTENSFQNYGSAHSAGNIIGVAFDADNQTLEFYLATSAGQTASSQGTITTSEMDGVLDFNNLCPIAFGRNVTSTFNFGQTAFNGTDGSGALPTGFAALNTANLGDPAIDPSDDETPDQYFDNIVYTPNNGTKTVTGLQFQPDWVWIKARNIDIAHAWFDVLRGTTTAGSTNTAIGSNRSDREGNGNGVLSSFNSDGFTVAGGSSGSNPRSLVNKGTTANDYVAWCWKAGGAPDTDNSAGVGATPTAGSVKIDGANLGSALAGTVAATRLTANTESGFSIVTFEAPSVGSKTVAHGLSSPPEMLIFKSRSNNTGWIIQHVGIADADPFTDFISFTTGAASDNATVSDDTAPTSSVFTIGSGFTSGNYGTNQVAYCFHSVDGFSKISHYIGNGQTDGTFVFTGFRPAFVMIKSTSSGERWNIFDKDRDPNNVATEVLFPDQSVVESTSSNGPDFFANGFKVRGNVGNWNHDGERYIYMAIADQPFKYSNAR